MNDEKIIKYSFGGSITLEIILMGSFIEFKFQLQHLIKHVVLNQENKIPPNTSKYGKTSILNIFSIFSIFTVFGAITIPFKKID